VSTALSSGPDLDEHFVVFDCAASQCVGVLTQPRFEAPRSDIGVLIFVGGPQTRVGSHRQFVLVARSLARAGFAALRFDYRGMGDSDGAMRAFTAIDEDIDAAIDAFIHAAGVKRIVLWGLCDAATAALIYAPSDRRIAGVVALNPWARSAQGEAAVRLKHYYLRRAFSRAFWHKLLRGGLHPTRSASEIVHAIRLQRATGTERVDYLTRLHDALSRLRVPLLLFLSGRDFTAREFEAWISADAKRTACLQASSVQRCAIAQADHTFSTRSAHDVLSDRTVRWVKALA